MHKKLTITLDEEVYEGLHRVIGRRRISQFIELLVRPHVVDRDLEEDYRLLAADEAREREALEWAEATVGSGAIMEAQADAVRPGRPSLRSFWLTVLLGVVVMTAWTLGPAIARSQLVNFRVQSGAMTPTLQSGDYLVAERLSVALGTLRRGDVVVVADEAQGSDRNVLRRVVGLPGDVVLISGGTATVVEPAAGTPGSAPLDGDLITVPASHYVVTKDNPDADDLAGTGREQLVPADSIVARGLLVYWPSARRSWIRRATS